MALAWCHQHFPLFHLSFSSSSLTLRDFTWPNFCRSTGARFVSSLALAGGLIVAHRQPVWRALLGWWFNSCACLSAYLPACRLARNADALANSCQMAHPGRFNLLTWQTLNTYLECENWAQISSSIENRKWCITMESIFFLLFQWALSIARSMFLPANNLAASQIDARYKTNENKVREREREPSLKESIKFHIMKFSSSEPAWDLRVPILIQFTSLVADDFKPNHAYHSQTISLVYLFHLLSRLPVASYTSKPLCFSQKSSLYQANVKMTVIIWGAPNGRPQVAKLANLIC